MERFYVCIFIRCLRGDPFVLSAQLITCAFKVIADKLGTIITPDDRAAVCFKELSFPQCTLEDLGHMFTLARQPYVVVHNRPIIDINNTHHEKNRSSAAI